MPPGPSPYVERLRRACDASEAPWALGLDPDPERFWPDFCDGFGLRKRVWDSSPSALAGAMRAWCLEALEALGSRAAAIKVQAAWFETVGAAGVQALESLLRQCREGRLVLVGDAKRGDVGVSNRAYARAWLAPGAPLECDALTLSPYPGEDALQPFAESAARHGKGLYVLVRTSNPGSSALQCSADEEGVPLWRRVAELSQAASPRDARAGAVGMVVGASCAGEAEQIREFFPQAPLLVPGLGAQGGDYAAARSFLGGETAAPALFPTSRAVLFPPQAGREGLGAAMRRAADLYLEQLTRGLEG